MLFEGPIGRPRIAPHRLGIDVHKRVKLRIQPFDALKVSIGKFEGRDLPLANGLGHGYSRRPTDVTHSFFLKNGKSESSR